MRHYTARETERKRVTVTTFSPDHFKLTDRQTSTVTKRDPSVLEAVDCDDEAPVQLHTYVVTSAAAGWHLRAWIWNQSETMNCINDAVVYDVSAQRTQHNVCACIGTSAYISHDILLVRLENYTKVMM